MIIKNKLLLVAVCLLVMSSCSSNDPTPANCSVAWATDLQAEITAMANAATAYANDQTQNNCLNYKSTLQAYINKLKPYGNCSALTGQNKAQFDAALQEAEAEVSSLCQ
jgi:hypothetical protein